MGRLKTLDGGLAAMRAAVVEDPGDAPCQRLARLQSEDEGI